MNRSNLKELGEQLDAGETGLMVVAAADVSSKVQQAITNAQNVIAKELEAAEAELEAEVKEAEDEQAT